MILSLPLWYNLRLAAWWLMAASSTLVIFSTMIHYARKWIRQNPESRVSKELSLDFFVMGALDKIPIIRMWIGAVLIFTAGWVGGWTMHGMQQYNNTDGYRMQVLQKYEPYRYQIRLINGKPFIFTICKNQPDPDFEPGMTVDILFEQEGSCNSLAGEHFGWQVVRNQATGHFVDFREETNGQESQLQPSNRSSN